MQDQLRYLLSIYLTGTLSEEQRRELVGLLADERAEELQKKLAEVL